MGAVLLDLDAVCASRPQRNIGNISKDTTNPEQSVCPISCWLVGSIPNSSCPNVDVFGKDTESDVNLVPHMVACCHQFVYE